MRWLLPLTAVLTVLAVLALLVLEVVSMERAAENLAAQFDAETRQAEDRAEENRRLLERLADVMESMERSAREHRCSSELSLLQQTDLILNGHTHPEQYVEHLTAIGCEEFVSILPGLPTISTGALSEADSPSGGGSQPQQSDDPAPPRNEPDPDEPERPREPDDPEPEPPPNDDPPLICVDPPLLPPVCTGAV